MAPATIDLAGAEIELVPAFSRELKLRRALEEVRDEYDYVLIDCPPSLGLLTVNGLAAADDVIVPIQCEYYALEGLGQLIRNVTLVRTNLNPKLDVRGIVLTMYDARTKLADQVEQEVRAALRAEGLPDGRPAHGPPLRGSVVRSTDHRVRLDLPGRGGVPGAGERGEQWRDAAGWVRGSGHSSRRGFPREVRGTRRDPGGGDPAEPVSSPASTSTRRSSPRWPSPSARSASSSRCWCARPTTATS